MPRVPEDGGQLMSATHMNEVKMLGIALAYMTGLIQKFVHGEGDDVTQVLLTRRMFHTYYALLLRNGMQGLTCMRFPRTVLDKTEAAVEITQIIMDKYPNLDVTCFSTDDEAARRFRQCFEAKNKARYTSRRIQYLPTPVNTNRGQGGHIFTIEEDWQPLFLTRDMFHPPPAS